MYTIIILIAIMCTLHKKIRLTIYEVRYFTSESGISCRVMGKVLQTAYIIVTILVTIAINMTNGQGEVISIVMYMYIVYGCNHKIKFKLPRVSFSHMFCIAIM